MEDKVTKRDNIDEAPDDQCATDPGRETPDPAPWLGQVGEGATEQSGEAIARKIRELTHPSGGTDEEAGRTISGDPEMPIPEFDK